MDLPAVAAEGFATTSAEPALNEQALKYLRTWLTEPEFTRFSVALCQPGNVTNRNPRCQPVAWTMLWGVLAMVLMIVGLDQLLWRPVVVWAQKFRVEDEAAGPAATSWVLTWLRRSSPSRGVPWLPRRS